MAKHLFSEGRPGTGRTTYAHFDVEDPGKLTFVEETDPEPLKKAAQILADEPPASPDFKLMMLIPETVLNDAIRQGWVHDDERWKRWANDPDNAYLRVRPGRI